jgi:GGDEF domain-containing protein
MISILNSVSELDRAHELRSVLLDSYVQAIKSAAHYSIELDDKITEPHRRFLEAVANSIASGNAEALIESRATFRGLMRDYRDKAVGYLQQLRDELGGMARALEETLESLAQSDGNHATRLRKTVLGLREITQADDGNALRAKMRTAADSIEVSVEQIRKEHQLAVSQFVVEIRMLHTRIDTLEAAASVDMTTGIFNRAEMEERIRSAPAGGYHLLLFQVGGLKRAALQFGPQAGEELTGAFIKRLKNSLPQNVTLGRWSTEEFIAMVSEPRDRTTASGRWVTDHLSGAYTCLQAGKTVRPSLQVSVGIADSVAKEPAERTLERVRMFLTGKP